MKYSFLLSAVAASALFMTSCGGGKEENNKENIDTVTLKVTPRDSAAELKELKFFKVLASVPSPALEVIAVKNGGGKYNKSLVNPKENAAKYNDTTKSALNYGVYSSDLAYIASFKDNPDLMEYYKTTGMMAEKAGAKSVFDEVMKAEHFEDHIHNPDSLEMILNNVFVATEEFCQSQHNIDIGMKMMLGAWIESQFIKVSALKGQALNKKNEVIYAKVWESYTHLRHFLDLLAEYENHPELDELKNKLTVYADIQKDVHGAEDYSKEMMDKMHASITEIRNMVIN